MKRYWLQKLGTNMVCQWNPEMATLKDMVACSHDDAMKFQAAHKAQVRAMVLARSIGTHVENEGKSQAELLKQEQVKKGLIPDIREEHAKTMFGDKKSLSEMSLAELQEYANKNKLAVPGDADADAIRKAIVDAHSALVATVAPKAPEAVVEDDLEEMGREGLNVLCDQFGLPKNQSNEDKRKAIREKRANG